MRRNSSVPWSEPVTSSNVSLSKKEVLVSVVKDSSSSGSKSMDGTMPRGRGAELRHSRALW